MTSLLVVDVDAAIAVQFLQSCRNRRTSCHETPLLPKQHVALGITTANSTCGKADAFQ